MDAEDAERSVPVPTVEAGGAAIPKLGLGTWQLRGRDCTEIVERALELGYRHVDTAEYYDNHRAVGAGLDRADIDRDDLFLTTKVWRSNLRADDVRRVVEQSLEELGVAYVDLLLIHWPNRSVPVEETLGAMLEYHPDRVRSVGVSNFSVPQLRSARSVVDAPIVADQVEYHPYDRRDDLLATCIDADVCLTAYSPLAKGRVVDDDTLAAIGERYQRPPRRSPCAGSSSRKTSPPSRRPPATPTSGRTSRSSTSPSPRRRWTGSSNSRAGSWTGSARNWGCDDDRRRGGSPSIRRYERR